MSIVKTLPKHKSVLDVINGSKLERKFNTEIPEPCTEIDFKDFTQNLVTDTLRIDQYGTEPLNIRSKCNRVVKKTHKDIKNDLSTFAKYLLENPGVCIAGGSIVNSIVNIDHKNDYDVFFYNVTSEQVLKILNEAFEKIHKSDYCWYVENLVMYRNMISFENGYDKYQLILVEYRTVQEIIQYFDIGVSQVCITDKNLYITDYARFCLLNNVIVYDTDQCISNSYNTRIRKYNSYNKKFSVIFPYLTKTLPKEGIEIENMFINKNGIECEYNDSSYLDTYTDNNVKSLLKKYMRNATEHIPYITIKGLNMENIKVYSCKKTECEKRHIRNTLMNVNKIPGLDLQISQAKIKELVDSVQAKWDNVANKCKDGVITMHKTNTESDLLNAFTMHYSKTGKELFGKYPNFCEVPQDFVV